MTLEKRCKMVKIIICENGVCKEVWEEESVAGPGAAIGEGASTDLTD